MLESIRQFFLRNAFRKEMTFVIVLKLVGLFLLWSLFFSHSQPNHLNQRQLIQHFIFETEH